VRVFGGEEYYFLKTRGIGPRMTRITRYASPPRRINPNLIRINRPFERLGARVHFRIPGVCVTPTSRPSGPSSRVTIWPQSSFRIATSSL